MYRVSIELKQHAWKFGRTRNAAGTQPQASVSTAFASSPKLSRVSLRLDRNTENKFSISFRKHHDEKRKKRLVNFIEM